MSLADLKRRCARVDRKVAERLRDDDGKRFRTLQARAALAGFQLHALAGGGFVLSRWDRMRDLATLAEVEAVLSKMGPR